MAKMPKTQLCQVLLQKKKSETQTNTEELRKHITVISDSTKAFKEPARRFKC